MADEAAPRPTTGGYMRRPKEESNCIKFTLFGTNLLIWLLGVVILILSLVVVCSPGSSSDLEAMRSLKSSAITGIVLGTILFCTGFLGCCGAAKENVCMLATYLLILVLGLIFEIAIMALALTYVSSTKFDETMTTVFREMIKGARRDEIESLYAMQEKMVCCGAVGVSDYEENDIQVPPSCYDRRDPNRVILNEEGCVSAAKRYLKANGLGIGLVTFFTFFLQICAMAGAVVLIRRKRNPTLPP